MNSLLKSSSFIAALLGFAMITAARATSEYAVEIDLQEQRAYLLHHGRMVMESAISSGRANHRTPTGSFKVIEKDMDHHSSLYGIIVDSRGHTMVSDADADMPVPPGGKFVNAPMHYFMRFTDGIGMHAGYLPGYAASHGCVRLPQEKAIEFFQAVEIGTPVTVFGTTQTSFAGPRSYENRRPLQPFFPNARWW